MKKKITAIILTFISLISTLTVMAENNEPSNSEMPVYFFKDYVPYSLEKQPFYDDDIIYVPADEAATAMELTDYSYNPETKEIVYSVFENDIIMTVGSVAVSVFGEEHILDAAPVLVNECPYVSVETAARMVGAPLDIQDEGTHFNVIVSKSHAIIAEETKNEYELFVKDKSSETPYLIWVSKKDYKVRVFLGEKGDWDLIKEFTCAIGAPGTPTCTGEFRYYSREKWWTYSSYYVGPIMRFNGGYAIHSTLIRYNGVPYDNRVGMKLSHGCVRLQPQDINWLVSYVPLYTKIYITEQ